MTSPFFFIGKKDRNLHLCQDYWYLNEGTIPNRYPIPHTSKIINKLKEAQVFTKLNLKAGYNNVRIKNGNQWKAAFKTTKETFKLMVMFFGLCNSPAMFQYMMNNIFAEELKEEWLGIYIDNIIIFSDKLQIHEEWTWRILKKLLDNDLFLNLSKCYFKVLKVEYLGMIISYNQVSLDPAKVRGIKEWIRPTTVKQVWGFLGFANFYRKFIPRFSEITRSLNGLTKKETGWRWEEEEEDAFQKIKTAFSMEPIPQMVNKTAPFQLECDTSLHTVGAVLRQ